MSTVLILRTVSANMTSHGEFVWPASGPVECPDWSPEPKCGNGLHGFLWGEGDGSLADWSADAKWLVVEVPADTVIDLVGKVKFPRGVVVFCGDRKAATDYIITHGAAGRAVIGSCLTGGYGSTVTGGDRSTVTGGDWSTVTGGNESTVTGGYRSTVTGGDWSTVTGGNRSELRVRWWDGNRYRRAVGYIGEEGLLPNVAYRVEGGKFVAVKAVAHE